MFAAALAIRGAIAFVFFGSVDVINSIADAAYLLDGMPPSGLGVPHLPGVQLVIWAAGMLAFHTALPVTFLFKLGGCVFDAAIAAMLFDARGSRAGWLYACAPVPVIIFAIHGQWDSIAFALMIAALLMLLRDRTYASYAAGALFVLAVIAKPVVAPLGLFFLERKRIGATLAGMAACFAAWVAVLWAIGDPFSLRMLEHVLHYVRSGVAYFGAPFAIGIQENRVLLMIVALIVLLPLYFTKRLQREDAILFFYAFVLATCGLSAQYLAWLLPFLLLRGHFRFAALYSLVAGVFLVTFYASPFGGFNGYNFENLGAFAPLKALAWLTPSAAHAAIRLDVVRALGDYVIPLVCIGVFFLKRESDGLKPAGTSPLFVAIAVIAVMFLSALLLPRPAAPQFAVRMGEKIAAYNVEPFQSPVDPKKSWWVIPMKSAGGMFAATTLAYAWVAAWSAISAARGGVARDR